MILEKKSSPKFRNIMDQYGIMINIIIISSSLLLLFIVFLYVTLSLYYRCIDTKKCP